MGTHFSGILVRVNELLYSIMLLAQCHEFIKHHKVVLIIIADRIPVVKTVLPLQGAWVLSLVRELKILRATFKSL